jgi:hypothetical protein
MGNTSKPLYIQVSADIYKTSEQMWAELTEQGHTIQVLQYESSTPDIILAPNAMRMTSDMLVSMPAALGLVIKGARALRYAPHGKPPTKGKASAKGKKPHKGRGTQIKTETIDSSTPDNGAREPAATCGNRTLTVERQSGETTNNERTDAINI